MSAVMDDDTPHAAFGEGLIQQAVDTLAGWLVKTDSVPIGSTATEVAEYLTVYYLFVMAGRRHGITGIALALNQAIEIAKSLGEDV